MVKTLDQWSVHFTVDRDVLCVERFNGLGVGRWKNAFQEHSGKKSIGSASCFGSAIQGWNDTEIDTGDWHGRWMGRWWNLLGDWGMFQIDVLSPWDERDVLCGIWMELPDPQYAVSLDPEHLEKTRIWLFVIAIFSSILTDMKEFRMYARSCLVVLPEVAHNKVHSKTMLMAWRSALSTR